MTTIAQDVRLAWRRLRSRPGVAGLAILTIALGIGANTAIFSLVNGILLRPLPFADADRLVRVGGYSHGAMRELRARTRSLTGLAGFGRATQFTVTGLGEPERFTGTEVTANLFDVLGTPPALGRTFTTDEDLLGRPRVVILSHALWQQRFGGDPRVLGRLLTIDAVPREVVGVMPRDFSFPSHESRLWVPFALDLKNRGPLWGSGGAQAIGRMRDGVTTEEVRAEFLPLLAQVRAMFPWRMPDAWGASVDVVPIARDMVRDVETRLYTLLGAAALVLLIACTNVANLFLASAATRRKEIAVQLALGASRTRIIRQFLTETLLIAALGGLLGVILAIQGVSLLVATLPADTPRLTEVAIDQRVLLFSAAVTLLTGLAFGLLPALRASSSRSGSRSGLDLQQTLKAHERTGHAPASRRALSAALVIGEVALAVVIAIAAGLVVKSLWRLTQVDAGLKTERVLTAQVSPLQSRCRERERCIGFYEDLLARLRALPGVQAAGATAYLPLSGRGAYQAFLIQEQPLPEGGTPPEGWMHLVTPEYAHTMGIPLVRGRQLTAADANDGTLPVIVNEALARRFWPGQDPIGKQMRPVFPNAWRTVVGVVGNTRQESLARDAEFEFYVPYGTGGHTPAMMTVVARTTGDPLPLSRQLTAIVRTLDPSVPVTDIRTMDHVVASSVESSRATMWLLSGFAALALLLGAVGIYGVISDTVSWRTREVGVRIALGARPADVRWLVMRQGLAFALAGVLSGIVAALAATRVLRSQLYAVSTTDPATFASAALLLTLVACVATYVPARRAARMDPVRALRND